jgi:hypothetical protein
MLDHCQQRPPLYRSVRLARTRTANMVVHRPIHGFVPTPTTVLRAKAIASTAPARPPSDLRCGQFPIALAAAISCVGAFRTPAAGARGWHRGCRRPKTCTKPASRASKKIGEILDLKVRHTAPTAIGCRSSRRRSLMLRREFWECGGVAAGGAGAAGRPRAAHRLADGGDENDPEGKRRYSVFTQALADLGWAGGHVRVDVRWTGAAYVKSCLRSTPSSRSRRP